ncbi:MAG: hypothetical protein GDA56_01090 [Hormoscilla sp. GM7CHS1pb]|nr:hypothetical protein [Hormoscilla sp. GM7CHS1pb]
MGKMKHGISLVRKLEVLAPIAAVCLGMTAPVIQQVQAQPRNSSVNLEQLVRDWRYSLATCGPNVAIIALGSKAVCVSSTSELPAGFYTYDRNSNQLNPASSQATVPQRTAPVKIPKPIFTFTVSQEYSLCVEDILQLYLNREQFLQSRRRSNCLPEIIDIYTNAGMFEESDALKLIESADLYATTLLTRKLFLPVGQRRRIAQWLGYIYEIDAGKPEMVRLAEGGPPNIPPPLPAEPPPAQNQPAQNQLAQNQSQKIAPIVVERSCQPKNPLSNGESCTIEFSYADPDGDASSWRVMQETNSGNVLLRSGQIYPPNGEGTIESGARFSCGGTNSSISSGKYHIIVIDQNGMESEIGQGQGLVSCSGGNMSGG